jgi:outer membrane protein
MFRKLAIVTGMAIFLLTSVAGAQVQVNFKLGYVDIQKALNICLGGKAAAEKLNKELEKAKNKYEAQAEELKREKETLERQGPLLEEEVLQDKMRDFRAKYRDWERFRRDTENDIKQQHNEMVDKISKELIEIADQMGKEGGYTLIVERSLVPYIDPSLDITEEVIKRHDAKFAKKKQ